MGIGVIITLIAAGLFGFFLKGTYSVLWGALIGVVVMVLESVATIAIVAILGIVYVDVASGTEVFDVVNGIVSKLWIDVSGVAVLLIASIALLYPLAGMVAFWGGQRSKLSKRGVADV